MNGNVKIGDGTSYFPAPNPRERALLAYDGMGPLTMILSTEAVAAAQSKAGLTRETRGLSIRKILEGERNAIEDAAARRVALHGMPEIRILRLLAEDFI